MPGKRLQQNRAEYRGGQPREDGMEEAIKGSTLREKGQKWEREKFSRKVNGARQESGKI